MPRKTSHITRLNTQEIGQLHNTIQLSNPGMWSRLRRSREGLETY